MHYNSTWRHIAVAIVPELVDADDAAWRDIEATIARALSLRPRRMQRQLALLLRLIAIAGVLRFGRPLRAVDARRRERFLLALQRSPVPLLRRGMWGLRTLVLLGHYTRPSVASALGYRADARGWAGRRAPAEGVAPDPESRS